MKSRLFARAGCLVVPSGSASELAIAARVPWIGCLLVAIVLALCPGCHSPTPESRSGALPDQGSKPDSLSDVAEKLGVRFESRSSRADPYFMPDIMGSGAAFFDADGDDDLDILLLNGFCGTDARERRSCCLYLQESGGIFRDVTEEAGLSGSGYTIGVAVADIDNDGDSDIYVTSWGPDTLWQNRGDGTFTNITESAGITNPSWGTAASWIDFDRDGWLDLFVANYVDYYPGHRCEDGSGRADFCGPTSFVGAVDKVFRNLGGESTTIRFRDVTVETGLASQGGRGLGVVCHDFSGDGRPDVLVANDMEKNQLWVQQPNGLFADEAAVRGVAVNSLGQAEANMGVVLDDLDDDGHFDVFITHLRGETNTLFRGLGGGLFVDGTPASGLGPPSLAFTGFGTVAADLEHDGDLDLLVVNGRVKRVGPNVSSNDFWSAYAERNQVFLNEGRGKFREDTALFSGFSRPTEVSRALVAGDIDNDGDSDFLVTNCGGVVRLYRNQVDKKGNWLRVRAIDPRWNRDDIGAVVQVRIGERAFQRIVNPSTSYLSSHDIRLHFGLGQADRYDEIVVYWTDGATEAFESGETNRFVRLLRGHGKMRNRGSDAKDVSK